MIPDTFLNNVNNFILFKDTLDCYTITAGHISVYIEDKSINGILDVIKSFLVCKGSNSKRDVIIKDIIIKKSSSFYTIIRAILWYIIVIKG